MNNLGKMAFTSRRKYKSVNDTGGEEGEEVQNPFYRGWNREEDQANGRFVSATMPCYHHYNIPIKANNLPKCAPEGKGGDSGKNASSVNSNGIRSLKFATYVALFSLLIAMVCIVSVRVTGRPSFPSTQNDMNKPQTNANTDVLGIPWTSRFPAFSIRDPKSIGVLEIDRPIETKPGMIFNEVSDGPLPTNEWCQNLLLGERGNRLEENNAVAIPYIVDMAGPVYGLRTHWGILVGNDLQVITAYDKQNGITLGTVEDMMPQHHVKMDKNGAWSNLAVTFEWRTDISELTKGVMRTSIVRGSPYSSVHYKKTTPKIVSERPLRLPFLVDGVEHPMSLCASRENSPEFNVKSSMELTFDTSDFTWLVFVSEEAKFVCSTKSVDDSNPNLVFLQFEATKKMGHGMVRVAMGNNCTTGQNAQTCHFGKPSNQSEYMKLLRDHADVFPTGEAHTLFTFPAETSDKPESMSLQFNWVAQSMKTDLNILEIDEPDEPGLTIPDVELLMFALPHHREILVSHAGSSNTALEINACTPTLHGRACPVLGSTWIMIEHIHSVSFTAKTPMKLEMKEYIRKSLEKDLKFRIPLNYMYGAGDTYFSGKMLAKLARILVIAHEVGDYNKNDFDEALNHLQEGLEIWVNNSAASPMLYDPAWGGYVNCGCFFDDKTRRCHNKFPDCPALSDVGMNFGAGFYNDHHFHYGYHIYAAAVVAKFNGPWIRKYFEHMLLFIRDIANPSSNDRFFPVFRHKDWYLGSSWASGVVMLGGVPYQNGRNEESSSESVHAYEGVALFGDATADVFRNSGDPADLGLLETALQIREMGRLLLSTEIRSTKRYWHVLDEGTESERVYPESYSSNVVGMLWSLLAQQQTWFGREPWKCYGIQLMPITTVVENRDDIKWVKQMLPVFNASCASDPGCERDGWSVLILTAQAMLGDWQNALMGLKQLNDTVFEAAGGNGHSRTNTAWFIATRKELK